jgi:DUF4097 and DUF4098 domain-containing protein YvlB
LETAVYIPDGFNGDITATVSNGNASAVNVKGGNLSLRSSLKSVMLNGCLFNNYDIRASAGKIEYLNCGAFKAELHASAGSIRTENTNGILEAHCSAGNLTVDRHVGEKLEIHASAGNVKVNNCETELDVHASAGDVKINCEGKILKKVSARSSAGNVHLTANETGEVYLSSTAGTVKFEAGKVSGNIEIKSSAGDVKLAAGEVTGNITANSSVGSVHLMLPADIDCRIEATSKMGGVKQNINGNSTSARLLKATASMGSVTIDAIAGRSGAPKTNGN